MSFAYCNSKMNGLTFGCCNSPAIRWYVKELWRDGRFRGCNALSWEWTFDQAEQSLLHWNRTLVVTFLREPIFHVLSQISHHYIRRRIKSVAAHLSGSERRHPKVYDSQDMQAHYLGNGSLALAKRRMLHPRFFFGITEYSELSYCLLEHWLGIFNATRCT